LEIEVVGTLGDYAAMRVNGWLYFYTGKDGLSIEEVLDKFTAIAKHGVGRAFAWFKKSTVLTAGSVRG